MHDFLVINMSGVHFKAYLSVILLWKFIFKRGSRPPSPTTPPLDLIMGRDATLQYSLTSSKMENSLPMFGLKKDIRTVKHVSYWKNQDKHQFFIIYIMNRNFHIGFQFFKRRIILTSEIVVIYKYDLITSFLGEKVGSYLWISSFLH